MEYEKRAGRLSPARFTCDLAAPPCERGIARSTSWSLTSTLRRLIPSGGFGHARCPELKHG